MKTSKISEIIKHQKEKEVHKHEPNFNLEAKLNSEETKEEIKWLRKRFR